MARLAEKFAKNLVIKYDLNKKYYPYFKFKKASNQSKGVIFFIHGYGYDSSYHEYFADLLQDYDYYAIELPGHGVTPVRSRKDLTPFQFAKMTINLIEELNLKNVNLIGHSMGGGIAMIVASKISERINKLILVCPMNSFGTTNVIDFLFRFNPRSKKEVETFYKIIMYDRTWMKDPEAIPIIKKLLKINNENFNNLNILKFNIATLTNIHHLRYAERRIKKDTDTLLIVGKYDNCINYKTTIRNLVHSIPKITIEIFDKSGHIPIFEELGKYFNTIFSFIEDQK